MSEPCDSCGSSCTAAAGESVSASISAPPQASSASIPGERITMISVPHTALFSRTPGLSSFTPPRPPSVVREDGAGHAAGHQRVGEMRHLVGGGAAQLAHRLGDVVHAVNIRLPDQATVGVDRQAAAELDVAVLDEVLRFTTAAEAEALELLEHLRGEGVVEHGELHVMGRQA